MADAGTSYLVDVVLDVREKPGAKLGGKIKSESSKLADELGKIGGKIGSTFADGFTGAVEKVGSMAATVGKVGMAAAVGAAVYGVVGLNQELETTQVSLAAVLNANGIGGGMAGAMEQAAGWMRQMKKDAKDLPGEFSDLLGIVQSSASAAFNAGLDTKSFEKLASQGMAAAKAMSVPMDQAGRELAHLLEGKAGAQNVFGTRLGLNSENFNKKSQSEQLKMLTDALAKFEPAIAVFGETMDAQSSTLLDNAKTFLTAATGPLFNRIKGTLAEVNAWFDANEGTTQRWATQVGDFLVDAFDKGKEIVLEYGPDFLTFAKNLKAEFLSIWEEAKPLLSELGSYIHGFLKDPGAIDKLITLGKLYATVKLGGGMGDMFGGLAKVGANKEGLGGGALRGIGALGSSLQMGAFGYMAGGAMGGSVGADMLAGGAAGGRLGMAIGGPGGAAIGAAGGAAAGGIVAMFEGAQALKDANRDYYEMLLKGAKDVRESNGMIDTNSKAFAAQVEQVKNSASLLETVFTDVASDMQIAALKINAAAVRAETAAEVASFGKEMAAKYAQADAIIAKQKAEAAKKSEADKKKGVSGKGGVTIQKVEITVSSNQAPNQIARDVFSVFVNERRYRTSSPRTANFSAGR